MGTTDESGSQGARETLGWFRPAIRSAVVWAWAQALTLVLLGGTVLGLLRVERVDFGSPWLPVYLIGLLLVMSGPLWLASRLSKLMRTERCLLLELGAVVWLEGDTRRAAIRWGDIESVEVEGEHLVIATGDQRLELPARFEDIEAATLVNLLMDLRRRSLMGLPMRIAMR